jgi:hypothetical protein
MSPMNAVLLSAVIVIAGRWSQNKPLDIKLVVAGAFIAIVLSVMSEANDKFARQFALLILISLVFVYGPTIFAKTGLTGEKK